MELDLDKPAYLGEAQGPSLIPMQASEPIPPRMNGEASEGPTTAWIRSSYRTFQELRQPGLQDATPLTTTSQFQP